MIVLAALLVYAALLFTGMLSGRELPYRLAIPVLLLAVTPMLPLRRAPVVLGWILLAAGLLWLDWRGHARAILDSVPILVNLALCVLFARTLRGGREPLVTRVVRVLEGPERLASDGIAGYTRRVTWYWALLLGMQCALLCACWIVLATRGGSAQAWARDYLHVGGYLLPAVAMLAEYLLRRWRFRHLPQPGLLTFIRQLVTCWPQIIHGDRDTLSAP